MLLGLRVVVRGVSPLIVRVVDGVERHLDIFAAGRFEPVGADGSKPYAFA